MKFSEMEKLYISISISFVMRNVPWNSKGSISRANPSSPIPSSVHQWFSICGLPLPAYKLYTDAVGHFFCSSAQITTDVLKNTTLKRQDAAGIPKTLAPARGISIDHRRRNRSLEGLQTNVQSLKTYKAKLVVFPRRARKFKAGDSAPEELAIATQVQGAYMPIVREKPTVEPVKATSEMKSSKAYDKLRIERTNKRHIGARLKKAAEAEKEKK
ncbi:hypothetical protein RHGRI_008804 [Rhododendron griersonianum]|uniref:60S ribosomal protein L13 n=1 Tax=Rhododendron griersonianum TaxID=479676 RepID=A0AAV6L252_9ERIC|nr:hypothetical protein RHGRI_008804 [Rhododendron griersonianum]